VGIRLGRRIRAIVTVAVAMGVIGNVEPTTSAFASNFGVELNGTYRVMSNGDWAKSNEVFLDEKTVLQTWTVTSSCTSPIMCTGTVTSDQGWSAPMRTTGDYWSVDRIVENWMPCPDGTAAPGAQNFKFWGWDPVNSYRNLKIVDLLAGKNRTVAASGACGVNRPLVIELPMRLEKVS
jgi:hypothetical protein